MSTLEPGMSLPAATMEVPLHLVDPELRASGSPRTGTMSLVTLPGSGAEVGVWEHTPGMSTDVEVDEVLVVLSGRARIDFLEPELPSIIIGPGDIVRLEASMKTKWTITETLRKIYIV